jgi:hypothetical protein
MLSRVGMMKVDARILSLHAREIALTTSHLILQMTHAHPILVTLLKLFGLSHTTLDVVIETTEMAHGMQLS